MYSFHSYTITVEVISNYCHQNALFLKLPLFKNNGYWSDFEIKSSYELKKYFCQISLFSPKVNEIELKLHIYAPDRR